MPAAGLYAKTSALMPQSNPTKQRSKHSDSTGHVHVYPQRVNEELLTHGVNRWTKYRLSL